MRFVFDSTPDCEVIHGELYVCLRMMFGIAVTGILVCIFSGMLMYQLLSHEKKKMYWEQLEMRCRSFYQHHTNFPRSGQGSVPGPTLASTIYCSCCEECRYPPIPIGPHVYPYDNHNSADRFWTPGRIGNFYSPNPGDLPSEDNQARNRSGWSWRRFPWGRNSATQSDIRRESSSCMYQGVACSADSQYGFTSRTENDNCHPREPLSGSSDSYSMLDNRPTIGGVYVWGPPPPYSNPNSPARIFNSQTNRYQYMHHHPMHHHESHCQMSSENTSRSSRRIRTHASNKQNYENTIETEIHQNNDNSESTDTSSCPERISHTLPVRKMKKRSDNMASVKFIHHQDSSSKVNVQSLFTQNCQDGQKPPVEENGYTEPQLNESEKLKAEPQKCRFLTRMQGVENPTFKIQETIPQKGEVAESEVYFADVSSCCNISVQNDGQDSSLYDEALENQKPRIDNNQCLQKFQENTSNASAKEDEDYLIYRMGNRQMSIRSRMPIPLPVNEDLSFQNESCLQLLKKDVSQNSLCSSVPTPLTETTDDSVTPTECCSTYFTENPMDSSKKNKTSSNEEYLAPDAQYEIIQGQEDFRQNSSNLTNTISGLNSFGQSYYNQSKKFNYLSPNSSNSKTSSASIICRKSTGSNITNLIHNLGANSGGLLHGEASAGEEEMRGQSCQSDGTMDSGWQSGSEKRTEFESIDENLPR